MNNIVRAIFCAGEYETSAQRPDKKPLWQWSYGQVLQVHGLDLPPAVEVHFKHEKMSGGAVIRIGTTVDKITEVAFPEAFLELDGLVTAYVYVSDTQSGQTEYKISTRITARAKPQAWERPEDNELFHETIEAVNAAADRAETAAADSETSAAESAQSAVDAANAAGAALSASESAEQSKVEAGEILDSVKTLQTQVEIDADIVSTDRADVERLAGQVEVDKAQTGLDATRTAADRVQTGLDRQATSTDRLQTGQDRMAVAEDRSEVKRLSDEFGVTAGNAVTAVNNAGTTQVQAVNTAGTTQVNKVNTAGNTQVQAINTAGDTQIQRIQQESEVMNRFKDSALDDIREGGELVTPALEVNTFWSIQGSVAIKDSYVGLYKSGQITIEENDKYTVTMENGFSAKQRAIVFVDDDYNILGYYPTQAGRLIITDYDMDIPGGTTKILFTQHNDGEFNLVRRRPGSFASKSFVENLVDINVFRGKYLSVLGDSVSALAGYIPSANTPYYTGSNAGVSDVSQMWWQRVCDKLGMERLVINASSGAKISNIDAGSTFVPLSDPTVCQALHDAEHEPDVIIIFAGTNDFSKANDVLGEVWRSKSVPTENDDFSKAYFLMISRLQYQYPQARIYCCSLPVFIRTNANRNGIEVSAEGKTISDYNEVIRRTANVFGCSYIDLQGCGITRRNAYPAYMQDNATTPTHPNAAGHEVYANTIINQLK